MKRDRKYTDAQLRDILSAAPTRANAQLKAKAYDRSSRAIRMIYKLAARGDRYAREHWPGDVFVAQIRRAARAIGYVVPTTVRRGRKK